MSQRTAIGSKVRVVGLEHYGFGEVASYPDESGNVSVDFYRGPVQYERVRATSLRHEQLPIQTRCFVPLETGFRMGRVVGCADGKPGQPRSYQIALPNEGAQILPESDFRVRSILGPAEPVETMAALAQETPFFFEHRSSWVASYDRFAQASVGLHALDAASVELFPHQAEAVRRVLQDPHLRYLLADEVGLGKTIEAGAILRQLETDDPSSRSLVLVPTVLKGQWESELRHRFHLARATVATHTDIDRVANEDFSLVVVDEAHRLIDVSLSGGPQVFASTQRLCARAPHLLLLSATPILHRDAEVLALLHLLDPHQYQIDDLEGFRRRMARRSPIGRTLLALARSSSPIVIRRQLELLQRELADDDELRAVLVGVPAGTGAEHTDEWRALATRVRVLVAETWRLHRRLIRTRRSSLIEEGEIRRVRRAEQPECVSSYTEDPDAFPSLWAWLDELRNSAAARASQVSATAAARLREGYLELAQAGGVAGARFSAMLAAKRRDPEWEFASEILAQIERAADLIPPAARLEALEAILADRPPDEPRWIVFCPDAADADHIADYLSGSQPDVRVLKLVRSNAASAAIVLSEFATLPGRVLLVVDPTVEEGLNLQAADGLVLLDLPFRPLRLEQRVGRLDRLSRTRPLRALAILSTDDANDARRAFDRAWYEVVVRGLGLFEDSIADVAYLLEQQLEKMAQLAFERGPAALYDHIDGLRASLAEERREAEEQSVIDGTSVAGVRSTAWWKALEETDADEDQLASAFHGYVTQTLKLRLESFDAPHVPLASRRFRLRRDRTHDVLLPADRLLPLAELNDLSFTFSRKRATQEPEVELLRPGCRLLDWLRELADWDDRGRAFAVWRRLPNWVGRTVVVRVSVTAALDEALAPTTGAGVLDAVGRAALNRSAANWFARGRSEWFLQLDGSPAEERAAMQCLAPYDKRADENLGGARVPALLSVVGVGEWPDLCRRWSEVALQRAEQCPAFQERLRQARSEAQTWYAQRETRLRLRERQKVASDVAAERQTLAVQREHTLALLARPRVQVDAIGVYVLSAEACPR